MEQAAGGCYRHSNIEGHRVFSRRALPGRRKHVQPQGNHLIYFCNISMNSRSIYSVIVCKVQ